MTEVKCYNGFVIYDDNGQRVAVAHHSTDKTIWSAWTENISKCPHLCNSEQAAREYIFAELVKQRMKS